MLLDYYFSIIFNKHTEKNTDSSMLFIINIFNTF